jgi:hypothetical protein
VVAAIALQITWLGPWLESTGLIHFVSVAFVAVTVHQLSEAGKIFLEEFSGFFRLLRRGLLVIGLAHLVEFAPHFIPTQLDAATLIFVCYLTGILTMVAACASLADAQGIAEDSPVGGIGALITLMVGVLAVAHAFAPVPGTLMELVPGLLLLALLGLAAYWCVRALERVGARVSVLRAFARHFQAGVILIWTSAALDASDILLIARGLEPWRISTFAHYFFYAGLLLMTLAFDLPRHFSGLYVDVRKYVREEAARRMENPFLRSQG